MRARHVLINHHRQRPTVKPRLFAQRMACVAARRHLLRPPGDNGLFFLHHRAALCSWPAGPLIFLGGSDREKLLAWHQQATVN